MVKLIFFLNLDSNKKEQIGENYFISREKSSQFPFWHPHRRSFSSYEGKNKSNGKISDTREKLMQKLHIFCVCLQTHNFKFDILEFSGWKTGQSWWELCNCLIILISLITTLWRKNEKFCDAVHTINNHYSDRQVESYKHLKLWYVILFALILA